MHFHVAFSCDGLLREQPETAGSIFKESISGRRIPSEEVYAMAAIYKARGFEVIPPCDKHDSRGYCTGHTSLTT